MTAIFLPIPLPRRDSPQRITRRKCEMTQLKEVDDRRAKGFAKMDGVAICSRSAASS
jgi:hypothetical protein